MTPFTRTAAVLVLAAAAAPAPAANQEQIDTAIARGAAYLKDHFKGGAGNGQNHGIGPAALAGIALLEARTPADDPTLKGIAAAVRDRAYGENQTYQAALSLIFLDRLEDKADVPLIQLLGVRLMAGQNGRGGWTYQCGQAGDEGRLRAGLKGPLPPGKDGAKGPPGLHPLVQEYANTALANPGAGGGPTDDNSNTQFAVLALWVARRHGVPTDRALDLIERRFMTTQDAQGGWPYASDGGGATPSMTCAGLLGLATAIGRREEKRAAVVAAKDPEPTQVKSDHPFFNPPPRADGKAPPPPKKAAATDARDVAAARAFAALGPPVVAAVRGLHRDNHGLYFLWSVERVGVLYGHDKIGGVDWYALGADLLVRAQGPKGEWYAGAGADVDTAFAVLFLCKANLARDLTSRLGGGGTELRAGNVTPETTTPSGKGPVGPTNPLPAPVAALTGPAGKVSADLVRAAGGAGWQKSLETARDAKGSEHTAGLAAAIHRLDGDRKKEARDALADRLFRMTPDTLKALVTSPDPEVRRGAVLAAAMRDDPALVPELIGRVADPDELVVRAARAGLKSLTGQDHGPTAGATPADRQRAADAWRAWWATQKR